MAAKAAVMMAHVTEMCNCEDTDRVCSWKYREHTKEGY